MISFKNLNKTFPLSLKNIQNIIDRVHQKYPFIDKYEIILILKSFFENVRYSLVNDESVSIKGIFNNMKLIQSKNKKILKVKTNTPKELK